MFGRNEKLFREQQKKIETCALRIYGKFKKSFEPLFVDLQTLDGAAPFSEIFPKIQKFESWKVFLKNFENFLQGVDDFYPDGGVPFEFAMVSVLSTKQKYKLNASDLSTLFFFVHQAPPAVHEVLFDTSKKNLLDDFFEMFKKHLAAFYKQTSADGIHFEEASQWSEQIA